MAGAVALMTAATTSNQSRRARLLLKARPTPAQLADRLRPVDGAWPDGLELYLAAVDLADSATVDRVADRLVRADLPPDFAWLIEGPVDSLDGADFDVTRASPADAEVVERLACLARRIGARAINIHLIAPDDDPGRLTLDCRRQLLDRSLPFLTRFAELTIDAGAVPTIENMPPVLRMRRGAFSFTPIGMASADLCWVAERVPGLKIMPDTSHAGLYLNARHLPPDPSYPWSARLRQYLNQLPPEPSDLMGFLSGLEAHVANAQISNAAGLLDEGLPYGEGELDLDRAVRWLSERVGHIVTETLEANNDDAVQMREALRRMRAALT
jgi:hypothetical protein